MSEPVGCGVIDEDCGDSSCASSVTHSAAGDRP